MNKEDNKSVGFSCYDTIYLKFNYIGEDEFEDLIEYIENEHISYEGATDIVYDLQQENKELKERINTYENPEDLTLMCMYCTEKVMDEIFKLKDNWNKLKEWLEEGKKVASEKDNRIGYNFTTLVLDKMQEIEGGMNDRRL